MDDTLEKNLELRKALAEVDRLTALNLELETKNEDAWRLIDMQQDEKSELFDRLRKKEVMLRSHESDITALQKKIVHIESFIKKDIEETNEALRNERTWIGHSANENDDHMEKLTMDEIFNLELRLEFLKGLLNQMK